MAYNDAAVLIVAHDQLMYDLFMTEGRYVDNPCVVQSDQGALEALIRATQTVSHATQSRTIVAAELVSVST